MNKSAFAIYNPMYWVGTLLIIFMGLYMVFSGKKELSEFEQVTGPITSILEKHPDFPRRAGPKDRYIQVAGFEKAFEVYLGGESGDFLPDFQSIAKLRPGDTVTVYYEEAPFFAQSNGEAEKIIFFTQQIEKEGKPHYIRGDFNLFFGNFMIIAGGLIAAFLFIYRNK
ncbi:hypothetical protein [Rufibacter aurantiacus]|uniref:hypothetical protein n=1 Tax=Rufibacter aurantiacus TaxID=2817374 RepID=UPI001B304335|nr:hypothetical protein [Rufibacter aurantiacus]